MPFIRTDDHQDSIEHSLFDVLAFLRVIGTTDFNLTVVHLENISAIIELRILKCCVAS